MIDLAEHIRESLDLAQLALELNAVWPTMAARHRRFWNEWQANCWFEVGGHSPSIKLREGWVRCADCGTTLYKASPPDVERLAAAMEAAGFGGGS